MIKYDKLLGSSKMAKKSKPDKKPASKLKSDSTDILDMKQAIKLLKTTQPTFYRWLREGKVKGMKVGRQWRFNRDDIERFMRGEEPQVNIPSDINPLIKTLKKRLTDSGVKIKATKETKLQQVYDLILRLGIALNASDIHLDLFQDTALLRYRVWGELHEVAKIDSKLIPLLIEQFKRMAKFNVQETNLPQDGRIFFKADGEQRDIRIQILPSVFGEVFVARILDQKAANVTIDSLPYRDAHKLIITKHLDLDWGIVICSGPTGSGKTTTLYATLNYLNKPGRKLISVEDPVEHYIKGVTQLPVNESIGFTFPHAMKCALRADPDVVAVGEIRDLETASIVLSTALSGHLVLTQLHADSAIKALFRLIEIGLPTYMVAAALGLIIGQKLIRKVCPDCCKKTKPKPDEIDRAKHIAETGGIKWKSLPKKWVKAVGCKQCRQLGYKGRTVVNEMLEITSDIRSAIISNASAEQLWEIALNQGMTSLQAEAIQKAANGETTLSDALSLSAER